MHAVTLGYRDQSLTSERSGTTPVTLWDEFMLHLSEMHSDA